MKKTILIFLLTVFINAQEYSIIKKRNILAIQKLIKAEELVAKNLEKYIAKNYGLPSNISDLVPAKLLKSTPVNINIDFKNKAKLQLKYSLLNSDSKEYKNTIYDSDYYRTRTRVKDTNTSNPYVQILIKDEKAITFLDTNSTDSPSPCPTSANKICNIDENTFRWYKDSTHWIEYSKLNYKSKAVSISDDSMKNNPKVKDDLSFGTRIFVRNPRKIYMKTPNGVKELK